MGDNCGNITNCYATGNVSVTAPSTNSHAFAGGLLGSYSSGTTNCYRYVDQTIKIIKNGVESGATNTDGTACTLAQLNSASFYTDTLGWDADVWDFSNLDFANGKYSVLKESEE